MDKETILIYLNVRLFCEFGVQALLCGRMLWVESLKIREIR